MKSKFQKLILSAIFLLLLNSTIKAQVISDSVSILPGYTNQTFYSLNSGTVSSVSNLDWDLAFQLKGFGGSIIVNSKNNVQVWLAQKSAAQWATITSSDTTGIVNNPLFELHNSDSTWNVGALNQTKNLSNAFDLGWGLYDFMSHNVTGDSIYFIKLSNGIYKKLYIEILIGTTYTYNFKFADLDGTNEISTSIARSNFLNKNFGYFSIENNTAINREPAFNTWDLSFAQYLVTAPLTYKVAGVLQNDSVYAAKAYPVDVYTVSAAAYPTQANINVIGFDWKSYNFGTNVWTIEDSLVYFVQNRQGQIWKMNFTGFGGSANGNYYFTKEQQVVGINEVSTIQTFAVYPNPAHDLVRVVLTSKQNENANATIYDMNGRTVRNAEIELFGSLQTIDVNVNGITPGVYSLVIRTGNEQKVNRLVIQ
jgi:hypothetical protein